MKLHANAPFGPKGRATMVRRVVEQGWSLAVAGAGAAAMLILAWRRRAEFFPDGGGPLGAFVKALPPSL